MKKNLEKLQKKVIATLSKCKLKKTAALQKIVKGLKIEPTKIPPRNLEKKHLDSLQHFLVLQQGRRHLAIPKASKNTAELKHSSQCIYMQILKYFIFTGRYQ